MTLYEIVDILKKIALDQPNIRTTTDGSVYDALNTNPAIQYDVFHISQTNHQEDFETDYYGLQLFYISRLEDSLEDNRLQIQSIGKEILGNVIRTFCENFAIDYPTITYIPFTQKFNDLTAGVYCNVRLEVPKDLVCADDYLAEVVPGSGLKLQDIGITITQNGLIVITPDAEYDGIGEIRIETNVPQSTAELQYKEVEYTENGEYTVRPDQDYDGLTEVAVSVDVPDRYEEGYDDGKEDGIEEQKGKLVVTSFTENDTYTRADGWSAVTVNVPQGQGYEEGYEDGVADQKAKMISLSVTANGEYNREDGYSAVTVNVPATEDRYDEGYADGEAAQKAKMVATAITENGEYGRPDGYSAITVNVPQTGSTNEDLIANLQGDYYVIPDGTDHLRDYAFSHTCFSSITIPTSVSAIGQYAFGYNTCLTSITIPDTVQSIGSRAFFGCSNLQTAILGSGITELPEGLFYNCGSLTGITIPSTIAAIGNRAFYECSGLTEMTFEGLVPPTLASTANSLGSTAYSFPIYVPCQSVEDYKTAFGSLYAARIQCKPVDMITAITLNVPSAITDSGTAATTYDPATATTDIHYTSSDTTKAVIDDTTGVITVIDDGTVTICAYDSISGLRDCETVSVDLSSNHNVLDFVYLTTEPNQTIDMFYGYDDQRANNFYHYYDNISYMEIDGNTVQKSAGTIHYTTPTTCEYQYTFSNAGQHNVKYHITSAITELDRQIFSSQNDEDQLISANIMAGITKIRFGAFQSQRNMTAVTLPDTLQTLGSYAFQYCDLREVVIPDTCTSLFDGEEPALIDSISGKVFEWNTNLSSVTIGSGITNIPTNTFYQCSGLTTVIMRNPVPPIFTRTSPVSPTPAPVVEPFEGCPLEHIFVPAESVNAYKAATDWSDFANIITAIIP